MKIYSLQITPTNPDHASPIYEVHDWDKVEQIIKATREIYDGAFTFEVFGRVEERQGN
mgnify:CR=1 FL=1|jgi:hypothetical protein